MGDEVYNLAFSILYNTQVILICLDSGARERCQGDAVRLRREEEGGARARGRLPGLGRARSQDRQGGQGVDVMSGFLALTSTG